MSELCNSLIVFTAETVKDVYKWDHNLFIFNKRKIISSESNILKLFN